MYLPPAISLARTLIHQERQLTRAYDHLDALDAIKTSMPSAFDLATLPPFHSLAAATASAVDPFTLVSTPASTGHSHSFQTPDPSVASTGSGPSASATLGVKSTAEPPRSRTAPQKEEITQKLDAVRRMKGIILTQLSTTTLMLFCYGAIVSECLVADFAENAGSPPRS